MNLIYDRAAPYTNALGITYDPGAYIDTMEQALNAASWSTFKQRQRVAHRQGRLRGIAVSNYIEVTGGGAPRERADIVVRPDGTIEVAIGTLSSGQGHETTFAQLLCEWLHVPFDCVRLVTGDTRRITIGGGLPCRPLDAFCNNRDRPSMHGRCDESQKSCCFPVRVSGIGTAVR